MKAVAHLILQSVILKNGGLKKLGLVLGTVISLGIAHNIAEASFNEIPDLDTLIKKLQYFFNYIEFLIIRFKGGGGVMKKIICFFLFLLGIVGCSNQMLGYNYIEKPLKSSA